MWAGDVADALSVARICARRAAMDPQSVEKRAETGYFGDACAVERKLKMEVAEIGGAASLTAGGGGGDEAVVNDGRCDAAVAQRLLGVLSGLTRGRAWHEGKQKRKTDRPVARRRQSRRNKHFALHLLERARPRAPLPTYFPSGIRVA
jgi:hypothetical protein